MVWAASPSTTTRWTLRPWNRSVRYDWDASVSASQIAVVSIIGTAPPYQSGIRPEGTWSTCSNVTSALYFFAIASTNGAVAVQLSDMSTGNRIFWKARMKTTFHPSNMHAVCHSKTYADRGGKAGRGLNSAGRCFGMRDFTQDELAGGESEDRGAVGWCERGGSNS